MKKQTRLLFAAMVIVAMAATLFVGCKKEKDDAAANTDRSEAQALLNRIKAFQTLRDAIDSGVKADGSMTVEEMRQTLDLVSNYEHSEHMTYCENTVLDTLYVAMPPVDEHENVTEKDVVATYETFVAELQWRMEMCDDGRNLPSYFSIIMPKIGERDENNIMIVFLRGKEGQESKGSRNAYDDEGPFVDPDDYWYWGDNLGKCKWDPYNATSDASEQLSRFFGFVVPEEHQGHDYIVNNVVHVNYRPSSHDVYYDFSQYYVDPYMENCADTWLYCHVSSSPVDLCIDWNELNCYWRSINRNIVDPDAPLHYTTLSVNNMTFQVPYHCCYIGWYRFYLENDDNAIIKHYYQVHVAHVTYCGISWLEDPLPPLN